MRTHLKIIEECNFMYLNLKKKIYFYFLNKCPNVTSDYLGFCVEGNVRV